jgi:hypothetical protein
MSVIAGVLPWFVFVAVGLTFQSLAHSSRMKMLGVWVAGALALLTTYIVKRK